MAFAHLGRYRESEQVVHIYELCFEEADRFVGRANDNHVEWTLDHEYNLVVGREGTVLFRDKG